MALYSFGYQTPPSRFDEEELWQQQPYEPPPVEPPAPAGFTEDIVEEESVVPPPDPPPPEVFTEDVIEEPPPPEGFTEDVTEPVKSQSLLSQIISPPPEAVRSEAPLAGNTPEEIALAAREGISETLKAAPNYWDQLQAHYEQGGEQTIHDQLGYDAIEGKARFEDYKDKLEPGAEEKAAAAEMQKKPWWSRGPLIAAEQIPAMLESIRKAGWEAMGWGATAAAAGQVPPLTGLPEEALSVPTATGAGFTHGQFEYWRKQGSGNLYNELRKEGVPHEVSKNVALGFGVPYAAI